MQRMTLFLALFLVVLSTSGGCSGDKAATTVIEQPAVSSEEQAANEAAYQESMK